MFVQSIEEKIMSAHINNWNGLQQYGINCLTGEACAYSMRQLCDLNEDGVEVLRDFFGMAVTSSASGGFSANWNSRVNDKPAVGSAMLTTDIFGALCRFILFTVDKCNYVVETCNGEYIGYTDEWLAENNSSLQDLQRVYLRNDKNRIHVNPRNPSAAQGSRNVHQMTGRVT